MSMQDWLYDGLLKVGESNGRRDQHDNVVLDGVNSGNAAV